MGLGDPKEEHHFDELENQDPSATFFQQGEIQPETVVTTDTPYGFGRPYRGQPNPVESEMTERNTIPQGTESDEGGNQFRTDKGILAKVEIVIEEDQPKKKKRKKDVTDPTEPAGLGETHPVKDNQWKPGDKSDRAMGRDEMLGSVRRGNSDNVPNHHFGWEIVDVIAPEREITEVQNEYTMPLPNGITDALDEALKALNVWVSNPEENNELRPYKEYWSVIRPNVTEGSVRIGVQDPKIADIINHVARTGDLSVLEDYDMSKISNWADFMEHMPEDYNPITQGGSSGGFLQGISDLASSPVGDAAAAGLSAAQPEFAPLIYGVKKGIEHAPQIAGVMKGALGGGKGGRGGQGGQGGQGGSTSQPGRGLDYHDTDSINYKNTADPLDVFNKGVDKLTPKIPVPRSMSLDYLSKSATYGEDFNYPSSISERNADPVSGQQGIDPHQVPDGITDWAYGLQDVNGTGSTNSPKGKDDARERINRQMESGLKTAEERRKDKKDDLFGESHAINHFFELLPLVMEFFNSDESGFDDPMISSLHDMLEGEFPGYLDTAVPDDENQIILLLTGGPESKAKKKSGTGFGPDAMVADVDLQPHAQPEKPSQQAPRIPDPSSGNFDPQTGPAHSQGAAAGYENQTSPNLTDDTNALTPQQQQQAQQQAQQNQQRQQQTQQQIQQQMQNKQPQKRASEHQGPHTDEQKDAVIKFIIKDIDEHPENYAEELAKLKGEEPLTDESPSEMAPPPPPPPVEATPPGAGMPPQTPPMGTPTPVNAPKMGATELDHDVNIDMLNSVIKYASDSAAPPCPKCKGHTTHIVSQKADEKGSVSCKCKSCHHTWKTDKVTTSDGKSSDLSSTSALDFNHFATLDTFSEPNGGDIEDLEVSNDTDIWFESHKDGEPITDEEGNKKPVEEDKEYDIYTSGFAGMPERAKITNIKRNSITYVTLRSGDLETETTIDDDEAKREGYIFVPVDETPGDNHPGIEENLDTRNVTAPGEDSDLSTPHEKVGSKTAGKHYTPMEQRELINEVGEARNADKLDLKNTHYQDDPFDDSFLFGC